MDDCHNIEVRLMKWTVLCFTSAEFYEDHSQNTFHSGYCVDSHKKSKAVPTIHIPVPTKVLTISQMFKEKTES